MSKQIEKISKKVMYQNGNITVCDSATNEAELRKLRAGTISAGILKTHCIKGSESDDGKLRLKFDAMASHDITYVGIVQTARASGLTRFPVPYVLTNCHNSLCAVGGTINEDDHRFGLSAAVRYGGIFVPPHQAVIHQYMREMMAGCGMMIIGSDSHTRYGALGTMAVGEGGPELVKQLLSRPYEINDPEVVCIYLTGKPQNGVGPQDIALAIIGEVFKDGFVKNKVMEFVGPGVQSLSVEYRIGIDVMTTETTCWSSVWETDEKVKKYLQIHGRADSYKTMKPENGCVYDSCVKVDLSSIEPMIALPFHPSNTYTIRNFKENAQDILHETEKAAAQQFGGDINKYNLSSKFKDGNVLVDQGVIAGCAGGTFENICRAAAILKDKSIGNGAYSLSVYPASQPIFIELTRTGKIDELMTAGATIRSAFCGPCFGAGDVPSNNALSIRHTTRNFPNREGSKPSEGQISWVALMDARSIAATSLNGGKLTAATEIASYADIEERDEEYVFERKVYDNRIYNGFDNAKNDEPLQFGPNIADWPKMQPLGDDIILEIASVITDAVTTTDELIPSGETSSYRSNPLRLAEFTLSRKDPEYVGRAKKAAAAEQARIAYVNAETTDTSAFDYMFDGIADSTTAAYKTQLGSVVCAVKPGDGSAREQAASCQKVLGGLANIAVSYATKRYRSNLINWGMLPLATEDIVKLNLSAGDRVYIKGIRAAVEQCVESVEATLIRSNGESENVSLTLSDLSPDERKIILAGSLINYYNT